VISRVTIVQNRHWDGNGTNWLFSVTAWIVGVKHSSQRDPAVQRGQGRADGENAAVCSPKYGSRSAMGMFVRRDKPV
jgi:hypothetical protein